MALNPLRPGTYVEEVSLLPTSVAQVATSVPAFIGYTENHSTAGSAPVKIKSMVEFDAIFGGPAIQNDTDRMLATFTGTSVDDFIVTATQPSASKYWMYYCLQLYFINGGGPCYIVSVGDHNTTPAAAHYTSGLAAIKKEDEPTLIVLPEVNNLGVPATAGSILADALAQCAELKDRFVIMDVPYTANPTTDMALLRDNIGSANLEYGAAYYPGVLTTIPPDERVVKLVDSTTGSIFSNLHDKSLREAKESTVDSVALELAQVSQKLSAELAQHHATLPPAAGIAGVYCSVDRDRGVWKAPANVSMRGVQEPGIKLSNAELDSMNDHPDGLSLNAIKQFTGKGTLVWGARTLAGNDKNWRYVPVRRLFITVEESVQKAMTSIVFAPNEALTWSKVRGMISNYLNGLWRQGALMGATPKDAYFVKVGLGETMTPQDLTDGRIIVKIGIAAVRPAEFIILKFSHKLQES